MKRIFIIAICLTISLLLLFTTMSLSAASNYKISDTKLIEGTNDYGVDTSVTYTVFILYPTAAGDYTVTTNDGLMGIVSYLDMWVQFEPTEEIVNSNTIEWTCTDKNQSIMIAVMSDSDTVNVSVTRKDLDTSNEVEWTIYENLQKPEKFTMPDFVDVSAFDDGYVDFEDSVIDNAVLGDDGYYHLNDKNGPVLFANINDPIMSIYTMSGYGRVAAIYYDDAGEVVKKVDYTDAFNQYVSALPTNESGAITSYYYPLTADLIEMFKEIGDTHGWYSGDEAWVYESDDAWMFACYYDEAVTSMNPDDNDNTNDNTNTGDNNVGDNTNNDNKDNNDADNNTDNILDDNDANTDTSNKAPATGDNTAVLAFVMLLASTLIVSIKLKCK